MSEALAYERDPGTAPEIRLAECWADVTKALALYPDSNERVRLKLAELQDALAEVLGRSRLESGADFERGATLLFQEDRVFVGPLEHTFEPSSSLAWLRARLDRSGLAGVELMPNLPAEGFTAFTRQLLDNFLRKDRESTFEALWPELYDGVVLVDRRFDGTFGGFAGMGPFAGGHGGVAGSDTRHFITGLLTHPKVRKRLAQMRDAVGADEETEEASVLLREVLDDVPADALKSRDTLIDWVCTRLDDLASRLGPKTGDDPGESEFATLMRSVSRKHFSREGPDLDRIKAGTFVETKPGGGRARDAAITDDIESLTAEVQSLPAELAMKLGPDDEAARPEQVAVILHYAVHLKRPEGLPGQKALLERALASPGPRELAVLREYVQWDAAADEAAAARTSAVIRVLEAAGRVHLLRASGALTADFVVKTFPNHGGHFLAALDLGLDHDLAELDGVLERVGPDALLEAGPQLLPAIEAFTAAQVRRLLEQPKRCRLPLARLLLQGRGREAVIATAMYLRELELPEAESFLLRTIHPVSLLTPEYLMGLIDMHLGRATSFTLRTPVSEVLCRHVVAVGDADPLDRARIESIKLLARYPSSRGRSMLKTLRRFGWGPFGGCEPPQVRRLARSLLKNWQ